MIFSPADADVILDADGILFCARYDSVDLTALPYGTPAYYYRDDTLIGKFYLIKVVRSKQNFFEITCQSPVGILSSQKHYGGIYTGQSFAEAATDIIGDAIPFSCDSAVRDVPIFGWLPIAWKRENLHKLLFSTGASISKDSNGDILCL